MNKIIIKLTACFIILSAAFAGNAQTKLSGKFNSDDLPKYVLISDSNYEPEKVPNKDPLHDVLGALKDYLDDEVDVRSVTTLVNTMDKIGYELDKVVLRNSSTLNNIRAVNNNSDFDNYFVFKRKE